MNGRLSSWPQLRPESTRALIARISQNCLVEDSYLRPLLAAGVAIAAGTNASFFDNGTAMPSIQRTSWYEQRLGADDCALAHPPALRHAGGEHFLV